MSRTTGRTLALLGLLQARREWTGEHLRDRLEVSARTVRRDIEDLRALGYGIEATRGVGGGYRLGPGAALPPLTLAADEAVAIAVGLRAAAGGVVTGMEDAAARALAKLELSLSMATREQIAEVERAMVPLDTSRSDIDLELVKTLARAIARRHRLDVGYRRHDGTATARVVEPHRIVHAGDRWYLIAWQPDHRAWRTLRVDRITTARLQSHTFPARQTPEDQLRRFTTRAISVRPYPVRARVRVHADAATVRRVFGPTVAEVTDTGDGTTTLLTGADRAEVIALYLGTSGLRFQLLDGEEVRNVLQRLSADFAEAAKTTTPTPPAHG